MQKRAFMKGGLLISFAIFVGFFVLMVVPAMSGTAKCSILPTKSEERQAYCPNCPPGHAFVVTDDPDGALQKGVYGCIEADKICGDWMDWDYCDWSVGVHICNPVCSDSSYMVNCSQVAKGHTTWISNDGIVIPQGWSLGCCGFVPAGGCASSPEDCATGQWEYDSNCPKNYRCAFSSYNGPCISDEDCVFNILFPPYDKLVCLKDPNDYTGEKETCRECTGNVFLSLPYQVKNGYSVRATVSGFQDCYGRTVYIKKGSCDNWGHVAKCEIGLDGKCSASFRAPCMDGRYTYYACVHKDRDENFIDPGEQTSRSMEVSGAVCLVRRRGRRYGGCPVLKVFDGKDFVEVETLDIHAPRGQDTVYSREVSMKPIDGQYKIVLTEASYLLWEGSHIDTIKLIDQEGKECEMISAVHSKDGDVLTAIKDSDDVRIETMPGEELEIAFEECEGEEFKFSIEGYNPWQRVFKLSLSPTVSSPFVILIAIIILIIMIVVVFSFTRITKR